MSQDYLPHVVNARDHESIKAFLASNNFQHHHLDWHEPDYWMARYPSYLALKNKQIISFLNCAPDNTGIAWIRIFAVSPIASFPHAWNALFPLALATLKSDEISQIASVCIFDWFAELLAGSNFQHLEDIVAFRFSGERYLQDRSWQNIRAMSSQDLPAVADVDYQAFIPLWQTPLDGLQAAFAVSWYSTVFIHGNRVVGFLISTLKGHNSHLARIAVLPDYQNHGIATDLITDYFNHCQQNQILDITLNTQNDNLHSISLYRKLGFIETGEVYPVYVRNI